MRGARPGRLGRATAYAAYCLVVFGLVFAAAEGLARLRGHRPWTPQAAELLVEPGGRLYRSDPALGYQMRPGRYTVRFPTGTSFDITHGADALRRVRPPGREAPPGAPGLWIFGCSFSYGWGVDDQATYPWQLQLRLPDWDVVNFSVNGYGTLQSLLQLERALQERPPPAVVVLAYAAFHDERNTFLRRRQKRVAPFSQLGPLVQPFARLGEGGELTVEMAEVSYREWPGMRRFSLVHSAERLWNQLEAGRVDSAAVTRAVVERFVAIAREAGARVIVAGIAGRFGPMLEHAAAHGAEPLVLAVDLGEPGMRNPPPDAHPSPRAHAQYTARLQRAVTSRPPPAPHGKPPGAP